MFKFIKSTRKKWWNSFVGLAIAIKEEKSLWAYLILLPVVIGVGIWVDLSTTEWAIILLTLFATGSTEVINTAIESSVDAMSFQYNIKVKKIKDIAAGATLIMSIATIIILLIIFIPAIQRAI